MGNKRYKQMTAAEFDEVRKRDWVPIELREGALPIWMQGIPKDKLCKVFASGTYFTSNPGSKYVVLVPGGKLVGGLDVYRNAPDDPVELNKDWYAVIANPNNDEMLLIDGPLKDEEHWIDEIPQRLKDAEVSVLAKKQ